MLTDITSRSICDLQEKFRPAIHEFPAVLATTQKLLHAASILHIPILATTQNRGKLGQTCAELELGTEKYPLAADVDKTAFSMWVPEFVKALKALPQRLPDVSKDTNMKKAPLDILIVGIETHICVLQTTLDALAHGHQVWVVQDAVSSCNAEERSVALARLRQEGARVTTSESVIYELLGDSKDPAYVMSLPGALSRSVHYDSFADLPSRFREIAGLVKESKDSTKSGLRALCNI